MKISVCMIVKNEEGCLDKTLESIHNKVDEIILVDTGSKDRTIEIAKKYTNNIYNFQWCDDFSKARNYSISKANNDWILVIDGDEVVNYFDIDSIKVMLESDDDKVGRVKRINPFEDDQGRKNYVERVNRLFNKNHFKYEGIIHEQLCRLDGSKYKTVDVNITLNHIGYMNEVIEKTSKLERNINLLTNALAINGDDSYIFYQLGKSYYKSKKYLKAKEYFEKAINIIENRDLEYVIDLIESYGYTLLKCECYEEALKLKKYDNYYQKIVGFQFLMGLIYMKNGMLEEAIKKFTLCKSLNELGVEGINSYFADYNIGLIYELTGHISIAAVHYNQSKDFKDSRTRLENLKKKLMINVDMEKGYLMKLIEDGELEFAQSYADLLLEIRYDIHIMMIMGVIKTALGMYVDAERIFSKILKEGINEDALYNLAYTQYLAKKYSESRNNLDKLLLIAKDRQLLIEIEELMEEIISKEITL